MKSHTPEGKRILEEHKAARKNFCTLFNTHKNPEVLCNDIERLTFVTLRRFRSLGQFPIYDIDDDK